ncbi:AraC family transcriptional regulator [Candidatus Enterococcus leclercqii]|uniref:AraC family transcriptional regulator n=1 Tax=Candidatus Enterococcus leclercqii TaxID=1857218 RepID=UPI00137B477A|nr:AraC family transcriptional regulator [Enterococcus sp. CU9D]KAF1294204.1 hypothetical protein BAU14_07385 [Enterococcus sp. CU9D]
MDKREEMRRIRRIMQKLNILLKHCLLNMEGVVVLHYKLERFLENSNFPAIFIIQKAEDVQILRHWHKEIEITYAKKGRIDSYFIEGNSYIVEEGEIVYVNPFEIHGVRNLKETSYPEGVLTIVFPQPFVEKYFPELDRYRISQTKISPNNISGEVYHQLINELNSIFNLVKMPVTPINNVLITASLLKSLGIYASNFSTEYTENYSRLLDEKIYQILDFVHKNYFERLTISTISEQFYISEGYLSRYFKGKVGVSVINYLELIRSYYAIQLIRDTDQTIEDIALKTGFASTKALNKTLKLHYKQTAKSFRK